MLQLQLPNQTVDLVVPMQFASLIPILKVIIQKNALR